MTAKSAATDTIDFRRNLHAEETLCFLTKLAKS